MIRGSTFQRLVRGPQTWVFDLEATGKRVHNRDVFNVAFAERLLGLTRTPGYTHGVFQVQSGRLAADGLPGS